MFKRKLAALSYPNTDSFNVKDEPQIRHLVVWLEDQKIRHYQIADRGGLRNGSWDEAFTKYLDDLGCKRDKTNKEALLDWLLNHAVRLEYADNAEKYNKACPTSGSGSGSSNPLDKMDFDSADFKAGVEAIANLFQIPPHSDHHITLKAISVLIRNKLSKEALAKAEIEKQELAKQKLKSARDPAPNTIPIEKVDLGFEAGDYITAEAAKILRLLHIQELRELQDAINEAIVKVQAITANPKTDTRLGKVGR